jgi:thiol-disulfide isomerase/thioredoxin
MALSIGSPAPELKVSAWLQGGPIGGFEAGQVYVVEFWSTWCGPCKATIPHLSKLAKQYEGRVTVIGVDIWENEDTSTPAGLAKVKKFVESMGDRMIYPVAVDSADHHMAEAWMRASGRQGIPSSFVVDGSGAVVWIGHPSGGLDDVLARVVAGTFSLEASKKQLADEEERAAPMRKHQEMMKPFSEALKQKNYDAAVKAIDAIVREMPGGRSKILRVHAGLACGHEEEALATAREIIDDPTSKDLLGPLGMTIAQIPDAPEAATRAGIFALEKLIGSSEAGPMAFLWLYGLALLVGRTGDRERAIELCEQAIAECKKAGEQGAHFLPVLEELRADF